MRIMVSDNFQLTEEELEIENALRDDDFRNIAEFEEEKEQVVQCAKNTLRVL